MGPRRSVCFEWQQCMQAVCQHDDIGFGNKGRGELDTRLYVQVSD